MIMNNSDILRKTITDNKINSKKAQIIEKEVITATRKAQEKMQMTFPKYNFIWEKELKKTDIHNNIKNMFINNLVGTNLTINKSGIKPDGGLLYLKIGEMKFLLGATEAKIQGTNDIRLEEGKCKQARGNAIERSTKNYLEICNFLSNENICPYLIFMNGCDLEDTSSYIRDRITSMNLGSPFNNLYIENIPDIYGKLHPRASIFIGISDTDIMVDKIFEMFCISMKYYLIKYQKECQ